MARREIDDLDTVADGVVVRLSARFPDAPEGEVFELVRAELIDLADARVQKFVAVLVERRVEQRLHRGDVGDVLGTSP